MEADSVMVFGEDLMASIKRYRYFIFEPGLHDLEQVDLFSQQRVWKHFRQSPVSQLHCVKG